ncbi:hypothetical protein GTA51_10090 [Desulfovibrio aerotolerans]|uniref:Uncharacterized protein n=1 Tax=Solidesulfovibrio aerotolerans TaxID=295255 RepID=A0A7C9MVB9_9BACT|nr:hypothetical protein [Solidesulfovibrio aerotolerans]MYL83474.1 hypothetical protein [Solidesulfovibrio aerotolerans]
MVKIINFFPKKLLPLILAFAVLFVQFGCAEKRTAINHIGSSVSCVDSDFKALKYTAYVESNANKFAIVNDNEYRADETIKGTNLSIIEITRYRIEVMNKITGVKEFVLHVDQGL